LWMLWVFVFLSNVILMNLLVAVMNDSFAVVRSKGEGRAEWIYEFVLRVAYSRTVLCPVPPPFTVFYHAAKLLVWCFDRTTFGRANFNRTISEMLTFPQLDSSSTEERENMVFCDDHIMSLYVWKEMKKRRDHAAMHWGENEAWGAQKEEPLGSPVRHQPHPAPVWDAESSDATTAIRRIRSGTTTDDSLGPIDMAKAVKVQTKHLESKFTELKRELVMELRRGMYDHLHRQAGSGPLPPISSRMRAGQPAGNQTTPSQKRQT